MAERKGRAGKGDEKAVGDMLESLTPVEEMGSVRAPTTVL
jgi:hypothetical protein